MIYIWQCDRRQFVDFISNYKPINRNDVRPFDTVENILPNSEEIILVWKELPTDFFELPRAVIVAENSLPDFLAWISTYFRHLRPFTAHCRVLTPSLARILEKSIALPLTRNMGSADIGLILTEGIAYSVGRTDISKLSFSAFARTLSFAYTETSKRYKPSIYENEKILDQIKNGWISTREILNQTSLELTPDKINYVWKVLLNSVFNVNSNYNLENLEYTLIEALKEVKAKGHIPYDLLKKIAGNFLNNNLVTEIMEGPRESRVKAVQSKIRELLHGTEETRIQRAFIIGYIVSRVQPGNLEHVSLLFPAINDLRESFLWYGAFSGLIPESSINNYGNGLGWLMKRELERSSHWLDRPLCDIALSEMAILFPRNEINKPSLKTIANGVLKVEIYPLVFTSVKWSEYSDDNLSMKDAIALHQKTMFNEETQLKQDVLEVLRKIEDSASSLDIIRKIVEKKFGEKVSKNNKRRK